MKRTFKEWAAICHDDQAYEVLSDWEEERNNFLVSLRALVMASLECCRPFMWNML